MLSDTEAAKIVANLAGLRLAPLDFIRVIAALGPALRHETANSLPASGPRKETPALTSAGNGATPPTPKPHKSWKARGRRGARRGKALARARRALDENPGMSPSALGGAANVSEATAKDAEELQPPANGQQRALHFLRGALSRGPTVASRVEELAQRKGIGPRQLERGKEVLGVTVQRFDDGRGACYCLPSQTSTPT